MAKKPVYDCIVIGGGPAGLTAALYLARYNRKFLIFDDNQSRVRLIPRSHNYPGYKQGITGGKILKNLRDQLSPYNIRIKKSKIVKIQQMESLPNIKNINKNSQKKISDSKKSNKSNKNISKIFIAITNNEKFMTRNVIFAMGLQDIEPTLPNVKYAVKKGLIRHCLICDGYEISGKKVAVIGNNKKGINEALFLRNYTDNVTLMTLGINPLVNNRIKRRLKAEKIKLVEDSVLKVVVNNKKIKFINTSKGNLRFEAIYSALGAKVNSQLAEQLKVNLTKDGFIKVNKKQETNVEHVYAIGDVVEGLKQISVAIAEGAIAATAVHNSFQTKYEMLS